MITSLRLVNFKNFADETLRMGPFTVIVGANASGKSNIRDAFRFLHGIGQGFTIDEIIGGKHDGWPGIRGAPSEFAPKGSISTYGTSSFSVHIELLSARGKTYYSIEVGPNPDGSFGFCVLDEALRTESANIFRTTPTLENSKHWVRVGESGEEHIGLSRSTPALTQLRQDHQRVWHRYIDDVGLHSVFASIHFPELVPDLLRSPSISDAYRYLRSPSRQPHRHSTPGAERLGDSGEDLPFVLRGVCKDPERKKVLLAWLRELTPMDVRDIAFPLDIKGGIHLQILDVNANKILAKSASDGTLRFLGMLAILLGRKPAGLYFVEEIENGFHPSRLSLLLELIERQTGQGGIQLVATTHSPDVLNLVNDTAFENTAVLFRGEYSSNAIIRSVSDLPKARQLRKSQGLGRLHASGWMEDMLAFAEAEDEYRVGGV